MLSTGRREGYQEILQLLKILKMLMRTLTRTVNKTAVSNSPSTSALPLNVRAVTFRQYGGFSA